MMLSENQSYSTKFYSNGHNKLRLVTDYQAMMRTAAEGSRGTK